MMTQYFALPKGAAQYSTINTYESPMLLQTYGKIFLKNAIIKANLVSKEANNYREYACLTKPCGV